MRSRRIRDVLRKNISALPFNNPALQAFMHATLGGCKLSGRLRRDKFLLVSVGTGAADPAVRRSEVAAAHAFRSLLSLSGPRLQRKVVHNDMAVERTPSAVPLRAVPDTRARCAT
jgi:hypothetical protein